MSWETIQNSNYKYFIKTIDFSFVQVSLALTNSAATYQLEKLVKENFEQLTELNEDEQ